MDDIRPRRTDAGGEVVFAHRTGTGYSKGDFPRNLSEQFRQRYDVMDWSGKDNCPGCGRVLCMCK